jgi:hypothetical protein
MAGRSEDGTMIGMSHIKARRLNENVLMSHFGLKVGECVPFYFCPRSVMLYVIHMCGQDVNYKGGQGPIIHLEADLHTAVRWAEANEQRWAFTLSNAGSRYFEDRADIANLSEINWSAVQTNRWSGNGVSRSIKESKQAEFLLEDGFPWSLVERIGVSSREVGQKVHDALDKIEHRPPVEIKTNWYYLGGDTG